MKLYRVWIKGRIVEVPFPGRYAGIKTQKVFGRLDCRGGMRALKKNRVFFLFWEDAVEAGYRPCKNCRPDVVSRRDCNHEPLGPAGPPSVELEISRRGRLRLRCQQCGKDLSRSHGYGLIAGRAVLIKLL